MAPTMGHGRPRLWTAADSVKLTVAAAAEGTVAPVSLHRLAEGRWRLGAHEGGLTTTTSGGHSPLITVLETDIPRLQKLFKD